VTAFSINSLANAVQKQGRNEEAAALLRRTLEIRRQRLTPEHPSVLVAMSNLSVALASMNRLEEAEPLLRESMEAQVRVLGELHPKTLSAMGNLAYVLEDQGKLDEAEALFRRVVENRRGAKMLADSEAWPQMNNLAMLLMKRGRAAEAEPIFAEILALSEGRLPPGHYFDAIIRNNYGECLAELGRYEDAERELLASQATLTEFFKPGHTRVVKGLQRLGAMYRAWGKSDLAAEFEAAMAKK
jgi:tetratricopeptide (TPR) repeat protein